MILDDRLRLLIDDVIYYGFPVVLLVALLWFMRRQGTATALYQRGQELQRAGHELARESIRVTTESNQLMRELIDVLRQQR